MSILKNISLTIAIPSYNSEKTIKKTLLSIINQDFNKEDVEIFISNNCSIDDTDNLVKSIINENNRFNYQYVLNESNLGYDMNIEKLIKNSNGKFVWLLGDDDFLLPGSISKVLSLINSPKYNLNYIYTNFHLPKNEKLSSKSVFSKYRKDIISQNKLLFFKKVKADNNFLSTNIFKKEDVLNTSSFSYYETAWMHYGIFLDLLANSNFNYYLFFEPLIVNNGRRPNNESFANIGGKAIKIQMNLTEIIFNNSKLKNTFKKILLRDLLTYMPSKINNSIRNGYIPTKDNISFFNDHYKFSLFYLIFCLPLFYISKNFHNFLYNLVKGNKLFKN